MLLEAGVFFEPNITTIARQSILLTVPNDEWLTSQGSNNEYASKSKLVNDLIRQARNQQQHIGLSSAGP